jgi:hypothetical protein
MPFNTDIRGWTVKVEFNISVIHGIVGSYLDEVDKDCWDYIDVDEGSNFWFYVCELENDYTGYCNTLQNTPNLLDWLVDNYNNVYSWNDVIEDVVKCSKQLHKDNMEDVFEEIVEKPKKKLIIKPKKKKLIIKKCPTWEDQIGFPTGIYNSYKEMIYAEYGDHSEQAVDLEKSFREAVELNKNSN